MSKIFKLFVLSLCLFMISIPCFAGNLLQQEYETQKAAKVSSNPMTSNYTKEALLKNDYETYLNGGNSFYKELITQKEKQMKQRTANNLNLRYVDLMLKQYDLIVRSFNTNLFHLNKINVDDSEYSQLDNEVKLLIFSFNVLAD